MGRFDDRLRRLERRFRDWGPSLEEVGSAFQRLADNARALLYGESVDENQEARDKDTIAQWQLAEGADLWVAAELAKQKLMEVGRANQ
jgi:hypothetical protein